MYLSAVYVVGSGCPESGPIQTHSGHPAQLPGDDGGDGGGGGGGSCLAHAWDDVVLPLPRPPSHERMRRR